MPDDWGVYHEDIFDAIEANSLRGVSIAEYIYVWTPELRRDFWLALRLNSLMAWEAEYGSHHPMQPTQGSRKTTWEDLP